MPTGSISPFRPTGTTALSAGVVSTNAALSGGGDTVVVTNATSSMVFVRFGADNMVTATPADMPVLPGTKCILSINGLINYCAAVASSGSGTVFFSRGDGSVV